MTISELCKQSHQLAIEKGFWPIEGRNKGELLMLMVAELSEGLEGLRANNPTSEHIPEFSSIEEELADAMIRIADMADAYGYRLEEAIKAKLIFNTTRPIRHGKQF